MGNRAITARI